MSTTAIATINRPSALGVMGARYNVEPAKLLETLKQTAFKNATDSQMMALVIVANEFDLNPFVKEIYAFPDKSGGIVPVVSVDGWLKRINTHDQYDGLEKEFVTGADGKPHSCTVTIHRKDRKYPTKHTELYSECFRNTDPWKNQPHRMLGHRATIQCARVAFGFAGADPEEVDRMTTAAPEIRKPLFAAPAVEVGPAEDVPQVEAPRTKRTYTRRQPVEAPVETPSAEEPAAPAREEVTQAQASDEAQEPPNPETTQGILAQFVTQECGSEWRYFADAIVNLQLAKGATVDMWTSFNDVPTMTANACLNVKAKLRAQLEAEALK